MDQINPPFNRRDFIGHSLRGAGFLVAGSAAVKASSSAAAASANPFAYDLEPFRKTDPKLIRYEEVARFACAYADPRRITIGPEDRIYIAAGNFISVVSHDGARLNDLALAGPARCVAVAKDGTTYAGLRDHVEVFDGKGNKTAAWETPGQHAWLTGLAAGENEVFVADAGNRVIHHYEKTGKLVGRIGEKNKDRNVPGLIVPSPYLDVAVAHDGLLRVNNPGRHRVEVYTTSGDLESFWGKPSAAIEGFCGCCNPVSIALLSDGRQITCEKGLPRVKVYSPEGAFDCVVAGPESFPANAKTGANNEKPDGMLGGLDATADSQGRIYILDLVAADVRVMRRKA